MKKGIVFIALLMVAFFLPSCASLKNSGSDSEDFSVEDDFSTEDDVIDEDFSAEDDITSEDDIIDKVVKCVVVFDSVGGTAVASQTILYGEKIEKPSAPTKPNDSKYEYSFDGWYLGDYAWDFETDTVSEDITLTARWKIESEFTNPFLPSD